MKKILFFMLALLAFVACDNMFGGTDDSTAADVAGDVTIEFSAVGDYGFTVTLTPTRAASFYSYLVDDDDVDVSAELDASTLYSCGYSSVTKGIVDYSEFPSYTFTLDGLDPDQTYFVYAVAGSPEGNVGEICAKSVVTNYVPVYEVYVSASYDNETDIATATVSMTDDVESVRVAVVERDSSEELEDTVYGAIDAIIDGTVDYKTVTDSCAVQFSVTVDGSYVVVAVAFGGGEAVDFDYATFKVDHSSWTSLGMCEYTDDYIASVYIGSSAYCVTYEVEIEENDDTPGLYRLVNPYGEAYPYNDPGDWDDTQDYYMEINASDPDGVYIDYQNTGLDWGYGPFYVYSYAAYYLDYGYSLSLVKMMGYCGTLDKGVITFPQMSLLCAMPEYDNYYYYANDYGMFKVVLPGTLDCAVDIEYNGKFTDTRDSNYAVATVELGEDVEYAIAAMVEGEDYASAIAAVIDGTLEGQTITESGSVTFSCEEDGTYTIVVVTFAEGEAQESAYVTFEYTVGASEWKLYGTGDYEYSVFFTGDDPGLELYQSKEDPTRFRILHWCYDVPFYFTWDQDTNEIVVDDQETGYTYSYYGMVMVDDISDYYGCGQSFYKDGIFYFSVVYYIESIGTWAVGCETFALEGSTFPTLTVDDLAGTYLLYGVSNFGFYYDEEEDWVFEASDDSSKGNIMLTNYDGWENDDYPIYGTFDSDGTITFDTGTKGIYFASFSYGRSSYDDYFVSYVAYYYSGMYGTEAYLTYLPNGSIVGPLEGDLICELLYTNGSAYGWNQAFECIAGPKYSSGPTSLSAPEKKEAKEPVSDDKFNRLPFKPSKVNFSKPAIVELEDGLVLASSSTKPTGDSSSANASKKSGSKKVSGTVAPDAKPSKESIKDSIRESKGWKN